MGRIAKVLSFVRAVRNGAQVSEAKGDPGGGPNTTSAHYSAPGDDGFPLGTDYMLLVPLPGEGREAAAGYLDPKNAGKAARGEKRIYSRDASGAAIADVWLKSDGTIVAAGPSGTLTIAPDGTITSENPGATFTVGASGSILGANGSGSFELTAGGAFEVNGVTIDTAGNITSPAQIGAAVVAATTGLSVAGTDMATHYHTQGPDSNGDTEVDTSGPVSS